MPRDCPACGRRLDGLMSVDHEARGLLGNLRAFVSDDPDLASLAVVVAVCLLVALIVVCGHAVLG